MILTKTHDFKEKVRIFVRYRQATDCEPFEQRTKIKKQ